MTFKPYSALSLALGGAILMGIGLYFVFVRPPLLPEDTRYMGASLSQIQTSMPGLLVWLRRVFLVMGGYIFTTGLLGGYLAFTAFRTRARGAWAIVTAAGLSSIGSMAAVNFIIASDFKWVLLASNLPWVLAIALYAVETPRVQGAAGAGGVA